MDKRKILAVVLVLLATALGVIFYLDTDIPSELGDYFEPGYYRQFGAVAIAIELFVAGLYLLLGHSKAHFGLALFSFTALLDILFDLTGLAQSPVPVYGRILFLFVAGLGLWIAYRNPFGLKPISWWEASLSFVGGLVIDLYFNNIEISI